MTNICTIHNSEMTERQSKNKFNDDGSPKTYWAHIGPDGMCFGENTAKGLKRSMPRPSSLPPRPSEYQEALENYAPQTAVTPTVDKPEEPMKRKDWNFKAFTDGLRALTFEQRKEDMHPVDVWDKTSVKDWMRTLYGDDEGYLEWERGLEARLLELSK